MFGVLRFFTQGDTSALVRALVRPPCARSALNAHRSTQVKNTQKGANTHDNNPSHLLNDYVHTMEVCAGDTLVWGSGARFVFIGCEGGGEGAYILREVDEARPVLHLLLPHRVAAALAQGQATFEKGVDEEGRRGLRAAGLLGAPPGTQVVALQAQGLVALGTLEGTEEGEDAFTAQWEGVGALRLQFGAGGLLPEGLHELRALWPGEGPAPLMTVVRHGSAGAPASSASAPSSSEWGGGASLRRDTAAFVEAWLLAPPPPHCLPPHFQAPTAVRSLLDGLLRRTHGTALPTRLLALPFRAAVAATPVLYVEEGEHPPEQQEEGGVHRSVRDGALHLASRGGGRAFSPWPHEAAVVASAPATDVEVVQLQALAWRAVRGKEGGGGGGGNSGCPFAAASGALRAQNPAPRRLLAAEFGDGGDTVPLAGYVCGEPALRRTGLFALDLLRAHGAAAPAAPNPWPLQPSLPLALQAALASAAAGVVGTGTGTGTGGASVGPALWLASHPAASYAPDGATQAAGTRWAVEQAAAAAAAAASRSALSANLQGPLVRRVRFVEEAEACKLPPLCAHTLLEAQLRGVPAKARVHALLDAFGGAQGTTCTLCSACDAPLVCAHERYLADAPQPLSQHTLKAFILRFSRERLESRAHLCGLCGRPWRSLEWASDRASGLTAAGEGGGGDDAEEERAGGGAGGGGEAAAAALQDGDGGVLFGGAAVDDDDDEEEEAAAGGEDEAAAEEEEEEPERGGDPTDCTQAEGGGLEPRLPRRAKPGAARRSAEEDMAAEEEASAALASATALRQDGAASAAARASGLHVLPPTRGETTAAAAKVTALEEGGWPAPHSLRLLRCLLLCPPPSDQQGGGPPLTEALVEAALREYGDLCADVAEVGGEALQAACVSLPLHAYAPALLEGVAVPLSRWVVGSGGVARRPLALALRRERGRVPRTYRLLPQHARDVARLLEARHTAAFDHLVASTSGAGGVVQASFAGAAALFAERLCTLCVGLREELGVLLPRCLAALREHEALAAMVDLWEPLRGALLLGAVRAFLQDALPPGRGRSATEARAAAAAFLLRALAQSRERGVAWAASTVARSVREWAEREKDSIRREFEDQGGGGAPRDASERTDEASVFHLHKMYSLGRWWRSAPGAYTPQVYERDAALHARLEGAAAEGAAVS